jgi:hypothetical protein
MSRSARRWCLAALALAVPAAVLLAFWHFALGPVYEHREWSDRMRADIESLAGKRPPDRSPAQWDYLAGWTINLHGNCGVVHQWIVAPAEKWPFLHEFERRLQGPVGMDTIDWVWDEYIRITKLGQLYSDKHRPTRSPDLKALENVQEGPFGLKVK